MINEIYNPAIYWKKDILHLILSFYCRFLTGVQYAIDKSTSLCSVDPIPISSQGFDAVLNITRNTLRMRNPTEFFNLDGSYVYVGKRTARSLLCDVYQTMTSKIPGRGLVLYETYFLSVRSRIGFLFVCVIINKNLKLLYNSALAQ